MSAKDRYHDCVKNALIKDGWVITHDPFRLSWGKKDLYVDLGDELLLAAEKDQQRHCRGDQQFRREILRSRIWRIALGQFVLYRSVLARREPNRTLFLAVPDDRPARRL